MKAILQFKKKGFNIVSGVQTDSNDSKDNQSEESVNGDLFGVFLCLE